MTLVSKKLVLLLFAFCIISAFPISGSSRGTPAATIVGKQQVRACNYRSRKILVPKAMVHKGQALSLSLLKVDYLPERFFTHELLTPDNIKSFANKMFRVGIAAGKAIRKSDLDPSANKRLTINKNGRAYPLTLKTIPSYRQMAKFDHVDISGHFPHKSDGKSTYFSGPLVENVLVLDVKTQCKGHQAADCNTHFLLLVLPTEVELLHHIENVGKLKIIRRNAKYSTFVGRAYQTTSSLLKRLKQKQCPCPK